MPAPPLLVYRKFQKKLDGLVPGPTDAQYTGDYILHAQSGWLPSGGGGITSLTVSAPLTITAGPTPNIALPKAGATSAGYLSATDWVKFNTSANIFVMGSINQYLRGDKTWQILDKSAVGLGNVLNVVQEPALGNPGGNGWVLSSTMAGVRSWVAGGTVTSVTAGTGLTATTNPITTTGTISVTGPLLTLTNLADAAGWLHSTGANVFAWSTPTAANVGAEPALGNPGTSGWVLSSTTLGVRSWVAQTAVVSGANPTASVGLAVVNGSAATFMRSDAAPPLAVNISPTWTGTHTFAAGKLLSPDITGLAAGISVIAGGTNQNVYLVTSGTGGVILNQAAIAAANIPARLNSSFLQIVSAGTGGANYLQWNSFASDALIRMTRANGVPGTPTALALDDPIGGLSALGYGTTGYSSGGRAAVRMFAAEAWTDAHQGAYISLYTTPTGSVTAAIAARLSAQGNFLIGGIVDTGLTGAGGLSVFSATDAGTTATGSIITAGGVGIAKKAYIGTDLHALGLIYAGSGPTTLTDAAGKILSASLNTVAIGQGGTGLTSTSQNYAFIGPTAGAGAPTWRLLVAGDIPALSYAPSALTSAHIFVGNVSNVATGVAMTGDISITNAGLTAIGANKVTLAMMATIANNTILGNISGGAAVPSALTGANVRTICGLATTDSPTLAGLTLGDQTVGGSAGAGTKGTAFGLSVLGSNTTGPYNVGIGYLCLQDNTIGGENMAIGAFAVRHNVSGSGNLGIGYGALVNNTTGYRNTGIGDNCLVNLNITADDPSVGFNTAIGAYAGGGITTGVNNTIIGANVAGLAAALSNNIILAIGDGTIKAQYASSNWTLAGCSLTTGAPAGGTGGKWKLGIYVATPTVPTGYIQVDVGGTLYEIPAKVH